jgi:hypothetical protein
MLALLLGRATGWVGFGCRIGDRYSVADRQSVRFIGTTDLGGVEFLITSAALAQMLKDDYDVVDAIAMEIFIEFEADIHRIANLEFVKRLGGEPPILLTAADVEMH